MSELYLYDFDLNKLASKTQQQMQMNEIKLAEKKKKDRNRKKITSQQMTPEERDEMNKKRRIKKQKVSQQQQKMSQQQQQQQQQVYLDRLIHIKRQKVSQQQQQQQQQVYLDRLIQRAQEREEFQQRVRTQFYLLLQEEEYQQQLRQRKRQLQQYQRSGSGDKNNDKEKHCNNNHEEVNNPVAVVDVEHDAQAINASLVVQHGVIELVAAATINTTRPATRSTTTTSDTATSNSNSNSNNGGRSTVTTVTTSSTSINDLQIDTRINTTRPATRSTTTTSDTATSNSNSNSNNGGRSTVTTVTTVTTSSTSINDLQIDTRVEIYWSRKNRWYKATIIDVDESVEDSFHIWYDDKTGGWCNLEDEKFRIIRQPLHMKESEPLDTEKMEQVCQEHYEVASLYIHPEQNNIQIELRMLLLELVENEILPNLDQYFVPIAPMNNKGKLNLQYPQAIRLFFSESTPTKDSKLDVRFIYGVNAVLKSTGMHPDDYIVNPFSLCLQKIKSLLSRLTKQELGKDYAKFEFDFNFMEIKIYLGNDIFQDSMGNQLIDMYGIPLKFGKCNSVGLHNDVERKDNGSQFLTDSSEGDHPIATFTLGATRTLNFQIHGKPLTGKSDWSKIQMKGCKQKLTHGLNDGSLFILLPPDETPQVHDNYLYKTKHEANFKGNDAKGVSFGFVFRKLKPTCTTLFHNDTNRWAYTEDHNYKDKFEDQLRATGSKYNKLKKAKCLGTNVISQIHDNIKKNVNML